MDQDTRQWPQHNNAGQRYDPGDRDSAVAAANEEFDTEQFGDSCQSGECEQTGSVGRKEEKGKQQQQ